MLIASQPGNADLIVVPISILVIGLSLAAVLVVSRWILNHLGWKGAALLVAAVWPMSVSWYAVFLDVMDMHYDRRWIHGTISAGLNLGGVLACILCAGVVTSRARWAKLIERSTDGGDRADALVRYLFGFVPALFVVVALVCLALVRICL